MDPTLSPHLSPVALLAGADPIVKAVMLVLVLASVLCWALAVETARRQGALRRALRVAGRQGLAAHAAFAGSLVSRAEETARLRIAHETGGEYRTRIERAMRDAGNDLIGRTDAGLSILATTASVAPFVGLFGTVWGVMNSFSAIAGANDTSLATVAPGIAEALFTTALGLAASIPALIFYNRLGARMSALARSFDAVIRDEAQALAARGATQPFRAAAE
jgi:biopolymer transport protein ExbB/TolQ